MKVRAWFASVNCWCTLITAIVCSGLMVWVSVGTYSYTTYGLKDDTTTKGLDIKGLVWTDINFISGVICGSSYLILGVTTVIFFVLAFHIIGQCLSCCCCCFSCSNCCIFFIMGILILACGLTEGLDELNGDTTQLIENEVYFIYHLVYI